MNKTALNKIHQAAGAKLVDFAGWEMPLLYTGIVEEHLHTRKAAGMFDVSHMGRLEFHGADADKLMQMICTRNTDKLAVGRCGYAHICNDQGGILDDVIVSRFEDHWLIVCNASNRSKIVDHVKIHMTGLNVSMKDNTVDTGMIAVQGPEAMNLLVGDLPIDLPGDPMSIKRYGFVTGSVFGVRYSLFRTGYTGEDGFELVVPAKFSTIVWEHLAKNKHVKPVGLAARDTLRLEAGMPLYGHELGEHIDPISAGCKWCCDLTTEFIGVEKLRKIEAAGPSQKLVGLEIPGRRVARQGTELMIGDKAVGEVTSGTTSPTFNRTIAMGYVDTPLAVPGTELTIDLRGTMITAQVTTLPFYKRS